MEVTDVGDAFSPQMKGPGMAGQEQLGSALEQTFRQIGAPGTTRIGPNEMVEFFERLSIPGFGGPFAAPTDPGTLAAREMLGITASEFSPARTLGPLEGIARGGGSLGRGEIEELMTIGRDVETRGLEQDVGNLRESFRLRGTGQSVGRGRSEAELVERTRESGAARREASTIDMLNQLAGREAVAAGQLPGAATAATGPAMALAQIGEMIRSGQDVGVGRELAEFGRTQGALFAPLINALLGQPVAVSPGVGTQALSAGAQIGGSVAGSAASGGK